MSVAPVLYMEDEEPDVYLMQMGFKRAGLPHLLQVVRDGKQGMDYLAGHGQYADRAKFPLPCLVLLDLNLPVRSGLHVLQWLRQEPQFQNLPVVIFTASNQESDKERTRLLGANEFITKPSDMAHLSSIITRLREHWLAPQ